jgi:Zn-dependent protease with chaperone function
MQFVARYFDGQSSQPRAVSLHWRVDRHRCEVRALEPALPGQTPLLLDCAIADIEVPQRFANQPWQLVFPQGQHALVEQEALPANLHLAALQPRSLVASVQASWPAVWCCVLLLVGIMVWFNWQGARQVSELILPWIPQQFDQRLGEVAFKEFDGTKLKPSKISMERQARLRERFLTHAQAQYPGLNLSLEFRTTGRGLDVNAFALPNGTLVMLDGLTEQLSDDGVMAVLGHELGHVVHRHSVRGVIQSVGLLAAAGVMLGDGSSVMSTFAAAVGGARFSRADEMQADASGVDFMRRAGVPLQAWVDVLKTFAELERQHGKHPLPLLATHPATRERLEAAQATVSAASSR